MAREQAASELPKKVHCQIFGMVGVGKNEQTWKEEMKVAGHLFPLAQEK